MCVAYFVLYSYFFLSALSFCSLHQTWQNPKGGRRAIEIPSKWILLQGSVAELAQRAGRAEEASGGFALQDGRTWIHYQHQRAEYQRIGVSLFLSFIIHFLNFHTHVLRLPSLAEEQMFILVCWTGNKCKRRVKESRGCRHPKTWTGR